VGCHYCDMITGRLDVPVYYRNHELIILETPIRGLYRLIFAEHGAVDEDIRRHAVGIVETLYSKTSVQVCEDDDSPHERWLIKGEPNDGK